MDRIGDDYPTLIAPGQPHLRANVTPDEILKYSPKKIDVINLEKDEFETIEIQELLREAGDEYPMLRQLVSIVDGDRIRQPIGARIDADPEEIVFTFDGLIDFLLHKWLAGPSIMLVEPGATKTAVPFTELAVESPSAVTIVIGPEGGWTPREIEAAGVVCRLVTMGGRTLRADAMGLIAISAAYSRWKEF